MLDMLAHCFFLALLITAIAMTFGFKHGLRSGSPKENWSTLEEGKITYIASSTTMGGSPIILQRKKSSINISQWSLGGGAEEAIFQLG
jgi:hypothetical protein